MFVHVDAEKLTILFVHVDAEKFLGLQVFRRPFFFQKICSVMSWFKANDMLPVSTFFVSTFALLNMSFFS